jgi:hypothetical protein
MSPPKPAKLIAMPATVRKNASSITAGRVSGLYIRRASRAPEVAAAREGPLT